MILIPLRWNVVANDKLATQLELARLPHVRVLPSSAIPTRDFIGLHTELEVEYPAIAKPVHWSGGRGVTRVADESQLTHDAPPRFRGRSHHGGPSRSSRRELVSKISGLLHRLGPQLATVRSIGPDGTVANYLAGGRSMIMDTPDDVAPLAASVAEYVGVHWLGVDFFRTEEATWLSEIELDAYMAPARMRGERMRRVAERRFAANRRAFDHWRDAR